MISSIIYTALIVLATIVAYLCVIKPKKRHRWYVETIKKMGYRVYDIPFKPFGIPFIKLLEDGKKQGDTMAIFKTQYPKYDVVVTNTLSKLVLDFTSPDFIKEFYNLDNLYTYPKLSFAFKPITRVMGEGVPFSEGEVWKRRRRIINTVFNFQFIKGMAEKISRICDEGIRTAQEKCVKKEGDVVEYNILDLNVRIFSTVMLECFLGGATEEQINGEELPIFVNRLMKDVTQAGSEPLPLVFGVKFLNLGLRAKDRDINRRVGLYKKWGVEFVKKRISETKQRISKLQNKVPSDIIEALLINGEASKEESYTEEQILEEFSTFFVAGTDTTSHYLLMMIYYVAQNPEVQRKLREEIDMFMKTDDYSYDNLKRFKYIDGIQKETTRMYGPITGIFLREAAKDTYLNGLPIPQGTYVSIQHIGNHYSQKYFKEPQVFRPERWQSQCDDIGPFVMGGFSAGARTCIGKHLAMMESKIGLIKFMKRYSKITLQKNPFNMVLNFVYSPEDMVTKLTIAEEQRKGNDL